MLEASRSPSLEVDIDEAEANAKALELFVKGDRKIGTSSLFFKTVFFTRSWAQLGATLKVGSYCCCYYYCYQLCWRLLHCWMLLLLLLLLLWLFYCSSRSGCCCCYHTPLTMIFFFKGVQRADYRQQHWRCAGRRIQRNCQEALSRHGQVGREQRINT